MAEAHALDPRLQGLRENYEHFHPEDRRREFHTGRRPGDVFLSATSLNLTGGTSSSAVADLKTPFDGNVYTLNEAAATPGQNLEVTFTVVREFKWVTARLYYNGGTNHGIRLQLWNKDTSAWDTYHTYLGSGLDYETIYFQIFDQRHYNDSGTVKFRFYHTETGVAGHTLRIDYVALIV